MMVFLGSVFVLPVGRHPTVPRVSLNDVVINVMIKVQTE